MKRKLFLSNEIFGTHAPWKTFGVLAAFGSLALGLASTTQATTFSREQDVVDLKLGQRVRVDDGTCPAGQVKEVSGAKMTETGLVRVRKCVPRVGIKAK
jgi:hypothetical protein